MAVWPGASLREEVFLRTADSLSEGARDGVESFWVREPSQQYAVVRTQTPRSSKRWFLLTCPLLTIHKPQFPHYKIEIMAVVPRGRVFRGITRNKVL